MVFDNFKHLELLHTLLNRLILIVLGLFKNIFYLKVVHSPRVWAVLVENTSECKHISNDQMSSELVKHLIIKN